LFLVFLISRTACGAEGEAGEGGATALFTDTEQAAFDEMYGARIAEAKSKKKRARLAEELITSAAALKDGLKHLVLVAARDLAKQANESKTAVTAMEQILAMKRGDLRSQTQELLLLQRELYDDMVLDAKKSKLKDKHAINARFYPLCSAMVKNALYLGNVLRAACLFTEAAEAEELALKPATLISSSQLTRLRQGIAFSELLMDLEKEATKHEKYKRFQKAAYSALDAGMTEKAKALFKKVKDYPHPERVYKIVGETKP